MYPPVLCYPGPWYTLYRRNRWAGVVPESTRASDNLATRSGTLPGYDSPPTHDRLLSCCRHDTVSPSRLTTRARSETVYAGMVYRHFFGRLGNHTATSFCPTAIPVCRRPLNNCSARNLASWLSGKSLKLLRPDAFPRRKICQKCVCGQGTAPDPTGGAYSATGEGREERKRKGKGKRGEEKEGER